MRNNEFDSQIESSLSLLESHYDPAEAALPVARLRIRVHLRRLGYGIATATGVVVILLTVFWTVPHFQNTVSPVVATPSVSPRPTHPSPSASTSPRASVNQCAVGNGTVGQNALDAAVGAIEHQAKADKSAGYAGVAICIPTDEALVYWKGTVPADVLQTIAQLDPRIKVIVTQVPASELELDHRTQQILSDRLYWGKHGINLQDASSDPSTGSIHVGASGSTSALEATREMAKRYRGYPTVMVTRSEGNGG